MNALLPDVTLVVERLNRLPGVTKIVAGSISKSPHSHRPGELKWVGRQGNGKNTSATIRAFSHQGMQNLHVYAEDIDALQKALVVAVPVLKSGSALPKESTIEKRTRESQPVYPAVASPLKAAEPVKTDVRGQVVNVSPDIAINWLERNSRNRPLRQSDVARYANDMKAGRWKLGGNVVKFAKDGTIINGQHFLWAVIESGCTIPVHVLTGLDPDVVMVEDDHARRRLTDVIRITHPGTTVTNLHTAVASLLRYSQAWQRGESGHKTNITRQQEMAFLEEFMEPIDFAIKTFNVGTHRRGISISPVITPVARAWFTEDRDKLARFSRVVATGMVEDASENSAVLLRNYLMGTLNTAVTSTVKQDTYRRVERAMRAYLDKERLTVLRPVTEELFLMPGERKKRK
jgi:hypothetical protein